MVGKTDGVSAMVARSLRSWRRVLLLAGLALAALPAAPAAATTDTFNYTGAAQTWTVPVGVTSASFDVKGAQGGLIVPHTTRSNDGGEATADLPLSPGGTVTLVVGGAPGVSCSVPAALTAAGQARPGQAGPVRAPAVAEPRMFVSVAAGCRTGSSSPAAEAATAISRSPCAGTRKAVAVAA